jgi:large subunit ribosomal protein L22
MAEEKTPAEPEKDEAPKAKAKPAAKKPAAKKPAAKKPAAEKAEEAPAAEKKPAAKKPAAEKTEKAPAAEKKPAAKKPAAKKPPAEPKPAAEEKEEPAEEATPAPRRRAPGARRPVVRAHARYVRTSARKARMVCGHLRGKSVQEARAILAFTPREVARDWSKLLESAVANAENNHELLEDDLIVGEAYADEGPTIKRFRPRAMGRATPIRKRTSHLTITLTPEQQR